MMRAEQWPTADANDAEPRARSMIHRQDQRREMGLVVDLDVLLAKLCAGEAFLAKCLGERETAGDYAGGDHGVNGLDREGVAQLCRVRSCRGESRQVDGGEAILWAWVCREDDAQRLAGLLGPRLDRGVIIALAAQQLRQEIGVGAGAAS